MLNKLVFCVTDVTPHTLTSSKLLFTTWENSFVLLELVKPCLNCDLCTFVHSSAAFRSKQARALRTAEFQLIFKCLIYFLKVYSPTHQTSLEILACDRPSNQIQGCVVLVWGKPPTQVVGNNSLTSLVRKQRRKSEKGKTSDIVLYINFHKPVCFSAGVLISTAETKNYTSLTAFSKSLTKAHE